MKTGKLLNWKVILAVIVFLVIVFFSSIVNFFVELQWFKEVGYTGVFLTRLFAKFELGIPIFLVLMALGYYYLLHLKGQFLKNSTVIYSKAQTKGINNKLFLVSVVVSFIVSMVVSSTYWYEILKYINSSSFNLTDPVFNKDISFYMFKLPVLKALYELILGLLIILAIVTVVFHLFMAMNNGIFEGNTENELYMDRKTMTAVGKQILEAAGKELAFIVSAVFIVIGLGFLLKDYNLVYSPRGVAFGASYTDVHVTHMFNYFLLGLSILGAISIFYALLKRKVKLTVWIIGIMLAASIIQSTAEAGVQKLVVQPNEIDKEKKYISNNIEYTKYAYGLDKIEEEDFPVEQDLTAADIDKNAATVDNIRINDFKPALDVYNQLQGIRYYYRFNDVDIDRYNIEGKYTQVFIAPRELDQSKLDAQSQTWQNKHLIYTHGYGITMSPVNTVTSEGQPEMIVKDIPPVSSVNINIDKPQIYFGELTDDYIITNTKLKEMDYPSGNDNVETVYDGRAGISLAGLNRLLFMIDKGSFNFLLSQDITSGSKIIMNRNIVNRVNKIAPFLSYDRDPYIVVNNSRLYWIIDAYTTSSAYPYSEPTGNINYIRNSVKVIIDAYNGTTDFYIVDDTDPVVMTYSKIFPGLFKQSRDMPQGFKEHFRYPKDIFKVQLQVYKKYHMTNPRVFYNKEDLWSVAGEGQDSGQENTVMDPSYIVMKLPEGSDEEFILVDPYTPSGKDNMVAWLAARMDGTDYGKLIAYKFPKQKVTYGPAQFKARINQNPVISKELSLWNQQGSSVINGRIIIIPIEKSLIYVMPIYIKSSGTNSIPEMKRVVLGYEDRIVMSETLGGALQDMFNIQLPELPQESGGIQVPGAPVDSDVDVQQLVQNVKDILTKVKETEKSRDQYINELEDLIKQLDAMPEK